VARDLRPGLAGIRTKAREFRALIGVGASPRQVPKGLLPLTEAPTEMQMMEAWHGE
jgi:hypothetical protein